MRKNYFYSAAPASFPLSLRHLLRGKNWHAAQNAA
jgi:hypothetical protein